MPKQLQSAIGICLILSLAHETKRRCSRSCSADRHAVRIVEDRIRRGLAAVGDASCAAERIGMVELAGSSGSGRVLRKARRIDGASSFNTALAGELPSVTTFVPALSVLLTRRSSPL